MKPFSFSTLPFVLFLAFSLQAADRGEVGTHGDQFIWTGTGQAFVPNFIMIDSLSSDLTQITSDNLDAFIQEFLVEHGFNGIHVPVCGQWFHSGQTRVTQADEYPDPKTFDTLALILEKVYAAGGCTHLWLWGDASRGQTAKTTRGGIMGEQEKRLLDHIAQRLGPLKGWTMSYGFDLWEWVSHVELKAWHDYMNAKPGWNHLMGARSSKNSLDQLYEGLDYSSYEIHKPWYPQLLEIRKKRPLKPSFSEDRYRIRNPSPYPDKDYDAEETLHGLWHHTLAGGIAAIWGNRVGNGIYPNKEAIKCFSTFWNGQHRYRLNMEVDPEKSDGFSLHEPGRLQVFYKENTDSIRFYIADQDKKIIAVDTRKAYQEILIGTKPMGWHLFSAPYRSDWALAAE